MSTEDRAVALGRLAKQRRETVGVTQREVAARAKVGPSTLQKLEYGNPPVERAKLRGIESALGWKRGAISAALEDGSEPEVVIDAADLAVLYDEDTPNGRVLDMAPSDPSGSLTPAGEGPAGERLGGVKMSAVAEYVSVQRKALAMQMEALDALTRAMSEPDEDD